MSSLLVNLCLISYIVDTFLRSRNSSATCDQLWRKNDKKVYFEVFLLPERVTALNIHQPFWASELGNFQNFVYETFWSVKTEIGYVFLLLSFGNFSLVPCFFSRLYTSVYATGLCFKLFPFLTLVAFLVCGLFYIFFLPLLTKLLHSQQKCFHVDKLAIVISKNKQIENFWAKKRLF